MRGSSFYLVRKDGNVSLFKENDEKCVFTVQVPPALGSNTSKTMTWHMTVTYDKVILSTEGHVVVCKPLSYLSEGVNMPVETKPTGTVPFTQGLVAVITTAIVVTVVCIVFITFRDHQEVVQSWQTTRAYPRCMRVGQSSVPGDVFCNGADNIISGNHHLDCTAFPHWLVRDQAWFDRRDHSWAEMDNLKLSLQSDGNLVMYMGEEALWSTRTDGKRCTRVCYEGDDTFKLWCGSENVVISKKKRDVERKNNGPQGMPGPKGFCGQPGPPGQKGVSPSPMKEEKDFVCDHTNRHDERCSGVPKDWDFDLDGPWSPKLLADKFGGDFIDHPLTVTLENKIPQHYIRLGPDCDRQFEEGMRPGDQILPFCGKICDRTGCIVLTTHGQLRGTMDEGVALSYRSKDYDFRLVFQSDGNLVLYNSTKDPMWSSETHNQGCERVKKHGNILSIECKTRIKNIQLSK